VARLVCYFPFSISVTHIGVSFTLAHHVLVGGTILGLYSQMALQE
jgi:hypothetical protein